LAAQAAAVNGVAAVVVPVGFGTLLRLFLLQGPHIPRLLAAAAVQRAEGAFKALAIPELVHHL
jgi:hypothetical protein